MSLSIRVRTILALNVFVLGLALVLGWIAQEVAGQVVEERFGKEMATGVSGFLKDRQLPLNNTMMAYLGEMFHAQWVVSQTKVSNIVASGLPEEQTRQFKEQAGRLDQAGVISLGGQSYRVDWADVPINDSATGQPESYRLFMLIPDAQFQEARNKAKARIMKIMLPSAAVATVLAVLLAFTITRPMRKLAGEMDRLATDENADAVEVAGGTAPPKGPVEIARLTSSFHRLLDRLAAARQRLAQHERLATLGKVCLSVAHELRNPLSGIKMHARLLKDRLGPSSGDSAIEVMLREIDRMEIYLDELMSLSVGSDPAHRNLNLAPTKLSDLSESVLTILSGRCRHAKITVKKDYPAGEPQLSADPSQLRQVMMNLMVNAIEAMPAGGTMSVSVCPGQSSVVFRVADTGKGIGPQERDIFDAFVTGKPNGVGLGLYLCKQIVTRHGGSIGYDDSANGATFWFELPLTAAK